jgi:aspartate carbamoyltransferase catalytic subunit
VNAGGRGAEAEHPTQALIDLFAIETLAGPIDSLTVALCGDLRMRAARSLLRLFTVRTPRRVIGITSEMLLGDAPLSIERRHPWDIADVDVLYVVGIPHEALPLNERESIIIGPRALAVLPSNATILSPMPVIDEISSEVRSDKRIRMFEQNDLSGFVRAAILEYVAHNA